MKALILLFTIALLGCAQAQNDMYKVSWLMRGADALAHVGGKDSRHSPEAPDVVIWMNGQLLALGRMSIIDSMELNTEAKNTQPLRPELRAENLTTTVTEAVLQVRRFVEANKTVIPDSTDAFRVVSTWFVLTHPHSLRKTKMIAEAILWSELGIKDQDFHFKVPDQKNGNTDEAWPPIHHPLPPTN